MLRILVFSLLTIHNNGFSNSKILLLLLFCDSYLVQQRAYLNYTSHDTAEFIVNVQLHPRCLRLLPISFLSWQMTMQPNLYHATVQVSTALPTSIALPTKECVLTIAMSPTVSAHRLELPFSAVHTTTSME